MINKEKKKHFKLNELIDIERHYDYEFVKKKKLLDSEVDEKWVEYIYKFVADKNIYFVRISHPLNRDYFFTVDFVEKDSYKENKIIDFDFKYNDLNQHDSMKVIATVFNVIKEYYENNIDVLEYFGFSATEKRKNIYKYVISKLFPTWRIRSEEKAGNEWIIHYDLKPMNEEKLNEEMSNSKLLWIAINLMFAFRYDVKQPALDLNYFKKYAQTIETGENNPIVKDAIKDIKYKINLDTAISNKKEILDILDKTPIIYKKNDYVCNKLVKMTGKDTLAWTTSLNGSFFIFISKDSDYNEIYHELNHIVEKNVKIDSNIVNLFDFNKNYHQQNTMFKKMMNNEYELNKGISTEYLEYLSKPCEIYTRINNFKMFLYKHGYLKTPVDEITEEIITLLFRGHIYLNLNEKEKNLFRTKLDFIELLIFLDLKNYKNTMRFVNENRLKTK